MKLFASPISPYARKVRVVLLEKRVPHECFADKAPGPDHPVHAFNPLGKIPTLVLDNGESLYDSAVICDYLDEKYPEPRLIPQALEERIRVKKWEALADGITDAAALIVQERRRPTALQSDEWIASQRHKIDHGIAALANALGANPWLVGDTMTLADIAAACTLGYLNVRFPEIDWPSRFPRLATWSAKFSAMPSFKDSAPRA